jgi:glycosyltransferase involved in cell wall biosynthesis
MRLCQIVPSLEERYGGPSKSVRELSAALAAAGHDVNLLATEPGRGSASTAGRLVTEVFHRDRPQALCPSRGLRARLRGLEPDIVHHHSLWLRTLHYASDAAQRSGTRLVISPRGMMSAWAWWHRHWRKQLARSLVHPGALEAAAGWHATSVEEEADIRALGFRQPVCVAPNGVDAPGDDAIAEAERHWKEVCPEVAKRPVALFYSRFHRKKRVLDLIDAWIRNAPRDWLLLVVGIPEEYTPEMLEEYALQESGADQVRVFSGAGHPAPYAVASLFLLPSHSENFGLVVAEALAHRVPVLVTDTTPWRALNGQEGGWCVPWPDYPQALRSAIAEGTAALRARGVLGREWVLREYSWEKPARILAGFYAGLGGRSGNR